MCVCAQILSGWSRTEDLVKPTKAHNIIIYSVWLGPPSRASWIRKIWRACEHKGARKCVEWHRKWPTMRSHLPARRLCNGVTGFCSVLVGDNTLMSWLLLFPLQHYITNNSDNTGVYVFHSFIAFFLCCACTIEFLHSFVRYSSTMSMYNGRNIAFIFYIYMIQLQYWLLLYTICSVVLKICNYLVYHCGLPVTFFSYWNCLRIFNWNAAYVIKRYKKILYSKESVTHIYL